MKRYMIILLALVPFGAATQPAVAQTDSDLMSIRAGWEGQLYGEEARKNRNRWRQQPYSSRIGLLEVGFNDFRSWRDSYSAYLPEERGFMDLDVVRSVHFTLNLVTFSSALTPGNWLGITMAVGLSYNLYTLDMPAAFEKWERRLYPYQPDHHLKRSMLHTGVLHIPFVLEFNPARNFFISAGGYADLVLASEMFWKEPEEALESPYVDFLHVGFTARAGFRHAYIFVNYAASELFRTGRGPRLNPYTFGLGFGF